MKKINHWINGKTWREATTSTPPTRPPARCWQKSPPAGSGNPSGRGGSKRGFPKVGQPADERACASDASPGDLIDQNVPDIAAMETADTGLPIHQTKNVLIPAPRTTLSSSPKCASR